LVVGNPGRIVGWMCECGYQLTFNGDVATCSGCEKQYIKYKEGVSPVEDEGMIAKLWVSG